MDKPSANEIKHAKHALEYLFYEADQHIIRQFRNGSPEEASEARRQLEALEILKAKMVSAISKSD